MSNPNFKIQNFVSIPDIISLMNAGSGLLSILLSLWGEYFLAAQFMIFAIIFDSVDGWVARKLNRIDGSDFGKNMDSLCDVISFGVAPGIFLYSTTLTTQIRYINILVCFLIVICGILRLARFNVISDNIEQPKGEFVGLPIPALALILSSFYLSGFYNIEVSLILMTISSVMMISSFNYLKPIDLKIAGCILIILILVCLPQNIQIHLWNLPAILLFVGSAIYLIFMPVRALFTNIKSGPHVR